MSLSDFGDYLRKREERFNYQSRNTVMLAKHLVE